MKKCYITGAADFAPARFKPEPGDLVIAADAGITHLERLGVKPDLVLGDFDSLGHVPDLPDVEVSPVRKDDTDSMLAARRALERGCDTLLLSCGLFLRTAIFLLPLPEYCFPGYGFPAAFSRTDDFLRQNC